MEHVDVSVRRLYLMMKARSAVRAGDMATAEKMMAAHSEWHIPRSARPTTKAAKTAVVKLLAGKPPRKRKGEK